MSCLMRFVYLRHHDRHEFARTVVQDGEDLGRIEELICGFLAFPRSLKTQRSIGPFESREDAVDAIVELSPTQV